MTTDYILAWTEYSNGKECDLYEPFEDFEEAREAYDGLKKMDRLKSITLAAVIDSTDYDTHPEMRPYSRGS